MSISKNKFLNDLKEIVKNKIIKFVVKNQNNHFNNNEKIVEEYKNVNYENFTLTRLRKETDNNNGFDYKKFNDFIDKNVSRFKNDEKFSIDSDWFEDINYDNQNNLANIVMKDNDILFCELTNYNSNSIFNQIKKEFKEGECSKCSNMKTLYFNCECNKVGNSFLFSNFLFLSYK